MPAKSIRQRDAWLRARAADIDKLSYYEFLNVPAAAEQAAIDVARRAITRLSHPDSWVHGGDELMDSAHAVTAYANVAHQTLSDPKARRLYDAKLLKTMRKCDACKGAGARIRAKGFSSVGLVQPCSQCGGTGWTSKA